MGEGLNELTRGGAKCERAGDESKWLGWGFKMAIRDRLRGVGKCGAHEVEIGIY